MLKKEKLIGTWVSYINDKPTVVNFVKTTIKFDKEDKLTYIIHNLNSDQIILLTYRVEGNYIVTDQPSKPHIEKTKAKIENGTLILDYGGFLSKYTKIDSDEKN